MPGKSESVNSSEKKTPQEAGHELLSGITQMLILLILRRGPQHGYELASLLEPFYQRRLSPGTIYPLLQRMENKEYIQSRTTTVSGRTRKTYIITRLGRIAMENAFECLQCIVNNEKAQLDHDTTGNELLKSLAQFRILLILDKAPLHGYDLVEKLDEFFGQKIALGTIYPSLHRLVEKEYIIANSEYDGERERKVYDLTTLGREAINYAFQEITRIVSGEFFS
ncbi:MAG: PadR family transcriptional regulator [Candidatus Heimdallarchaeota archaeon]